MAYWTVADAGVYFLRDEGQVHSIHMFRFADETFSRVGALPFRVNTFGRAGRLSVSRDGKWALLNVADRIEGYLMLVDHFR